MTAADIEIIDTHCHVEPWFLCHEVECPDPGWFHALFAGCRHRGRLVVSSTGRNPILAGAGNVAAVEKLAQLIGPFPDKIIGSVMVDPKDLDAALEAIEIGVNELGMRCVGELVQYIHGWRTDGREILPVVQKAIDLDVPLSFHASCEDHAEAVARLAEKFRRARIIAAHSVGGRSWRRGIREVKRLPNVWVEIMEGNAEQLAVALREVGASRITYGTDFGLHQDPELRYSAGEWLLDCLERLHLKDADMEAICSGNAKRLMGLAG